MSEWGNDYDLQSQIEQALNEPLPNQSEDSFPVPFTLDTVIKNPPALAPALIDGVLRQGHKMVLSGPSKAGKSFTLMELCIAIAEGRKWFGNKCEKGKVLYINMEIDRRSCINRFKKICEALNQKVYTIENPGNIAIWSLRGHAVPLTQLADKIIETAQNKYVAIVIDPLYKVIEGDENSNSDVSRMVGNFDRITEATGASVIYAHHFAKGAGGDKDIIDRAAGAGTFARDPDAIVTMTQIDQIGQNGETAWRVDYVLREFPNKEPYDVWFRYPLHEYTDALKDASVITTSTKRQKNDEAAKKQKHDKQADDILGIIEGISDQEGRFLFRRFYDRYKCVVNVTDRTARNRLNELGYYPDSNCPPGGTPYWKKREN